MSAGLPPLGAMRERVHIQRKHMSPASAGGHDAVYVPLATVWARVHALDGRLAQFLGARGAQTTHAVTLRFRADVSPGDRLLYRGAALEVISTSDLDGRRAFLSCRCRARTSAG